MERSEIYLIEIDAHNGSSVITLRFGSTNYVSGRSDSPANARYEGSVIEVGSFSRSLYAPGETNQSIEIGYGSVTMANADGNLDAILNYGVDGRTIVIKTLPSKFDSLSNATVLFTGTVQSVDSTDIWTRVTFAIRDRRLILDKPFQTVRYAGTTTSGASVVVDEGNEDIKDQVKPMVYGRVANVPMVCVNPYDLIYQAANNVVTSIVVYDKGVPLRPLGNFSTAAALKAATIKPGWFGTCLTRGLARLGGTPDGQVTADVVEGASNALRSAANVVIRMLQYKGLTSADYSTSSFSALHSLNSAEVGIFINNEANTSQLVQQVLDSVGGWISPNTSGVFEVGRFSAPTSSPVHTFTEREIIGDIRFVRMDDEGGGIPAYRATLRYKPIWTIMGKSDLAGCVEDDAEWKTFLTTEWREVKAEDLSVQTKHTLSPELKYDTLFWAQADAGTEVNRRLGLYKTRRDRVQIRVPRIYATGAVPGATVQIKVNRLGYESGRNFVVLGTMDDFGAAMVVLDLWG